MAFSCTIQHCQKIEGVWKVIGTETLKFKDPDCVKDIKEGRFLFNVDGPKKDPGLLCVWCDATVPKSGVGNHQIKYHHAGGEQCQYQCGTNAGDSPVPVSTHYASARCKNLLLRKQNQLVCLNHMCLKNDTHTCAGVTYSEVYKLSFGKTWPGTKWRKNEKEVEISTKNSGVNTLKQAGRNTLAIAHFCLTTGTVNGDVIQSKPICGTCRDDLVNKSALPLVNTTSSTGKCFVCSKASNIAGNRVSTKCSVYSIKTRYIVDHYGSVAHQATSEFPDEIDPADIINYPTYIQKGYQYSANTGKFVRKNKEKETVDASTSQKTGKPAETKPTTNINGSAPTVSDDTDSDSEDDNTTEETVVPEDKPVKSETAAATCPTCHMRILPGGKCYRCDKKKVQKKEVEKKEEIDVEFDKVTTELENAVPVKTEEATETIKPPEEILAKVLDTVTTPDELKEATAMWRESVLEEEEKPVTAADLGIPKPKKKQSWSAWLGLNSNDE